MKKRERREGQPPDGRARNTATAPNVVPRAAADDPLIVTGSGPMLSPEAAKSIQAKMQSGDLRPELVDGKG